MTRSQSLHEALKELARDEASLVHPTYRYLQRRPRFLGLTFLQWGQLAACALTAWVLAAVLPLPGPYDLSVAVTIAGVPAAGAVVAMDADFDVYSWLRALARWRRDAGLYLPGASPTRAAVGYVVSIPVEDARPQTDTRDFSPAVAVEDLWR